MEQIETPHTDVVSLLRAKNCCLQRVLELCEGFLAEWDSMAGERRAGELARFQSRRDSLFRTLELYDRRVSEALAALPGSDRTPELIERTRRALSEKNSLVQSLLAKDSVIMAKLESEKNRILDELTDARRGRSLVNKFKSTWVPESGEGLDRKL